MFLLTNSAFSTPTPVLWAKCTTPRKAKGIDPIVKVDPKIVEIGYCFATLFTLKIIDDISNPEVTPFREFKVKLGRILLSAHSKGTYVEQQNVWRINTITPLND
jgi:hypothetical protein